VEISLRACNGNGGKFYITVRCTSISYFCYIATNIAVLRTLKAVYIWIMDRYLKREPVIF
jgi:hypothetical protein